MADLLADVVKVLKALLGDSFTQPFVLLFMFFYGLHLGAKNFIKLVEEHILEPYFRPFVGKLNDAIDVQDAHHEELHDHEGRIRTNEVDIAVLQGKVLGGRIKWDDK